MAAPRLMISALALATLTLSACSTPASVTDSTGVGGVAGKDGGGVSASSAAPLTAEAYRERLRGAGGPVRGALTALAAAPTVKSLDRRVERAERALRAAASALAGLAPPSEAAAGHGVYVAALRGLADELGSTLGKVGSRAVCTPAAAFTELRKELVSLDRAGEALREAGYPADVVTVRAAARRSRRLGNGVLVRSGALDGRSSLQIHNGGVRDAVVTLTRGTAGELSVYVRKKSKARVRGVRDGAYRIYFTHGVDWDAKARAFTRECSFERFQEQVRFRTTYTATRVLWHDWRITLHAVSGGTAKTSTVDPGSFPR